MKKSGKVFLVFIAISLMASMANAVCLVDYWTLDPDGTDSSTVINQCRRSTDCEIEKLGRNESGRRLVHRSGHGLIVLDRFV